MKMFFTSVGLSAIISFSLMNIIDIYNNDINKTSINIEKNVDSYYSVEYVEQYKKISINDLMLILSILKMKDNNQSVQNLKSIIDKHKDELAKIYFLIKKSKKIEHIDFLVLDYLYLKNKILLEFETKKQ